jgi:pyruvate dehydrogenase E1 component alpha subunit
MNSELDYDQLYKTALRIRLVESRIAELYSEEKMRCPVHLSIGQEIPSAIFQQVVISGDTAISTHRAHAHYLAMGGDLPRMIAEIYGKVTGCSKGRGGSMHLVDLEKGFLGSSAIVGNSIPVGVGVGYAKQLEHDESVSFIFLGDGAIEEGSFYESVNFAALHKLPVVFVVENNLYSVYTGLGPRQPENRSITGLASAIGLNCETTDDSDFSGTFSKLFTLTSYSRRGNGASLLEINTYRKLEHCGPNDDDHLGYRPREELDRLKEIDLLQILQQSLAMTTEEYEQLHLSIQTEIDNAFSFAESSPFPTFHDVTSGVYAH